VARVQYNIGARVIAERTARGWSQQELAARAGWRDDEAGRQRVWRIENGRDPAVSEAKAIAAAFGMAASDLMGEHEPVAEEPVAS
jgi:transcriptional regulator with XRE-family HTH domain